MHSNHDLVNHDLVFPKITKGLYLGYTKKYQNDCKIVVSFIIVLIIFYYYRRFSLHPTINKRHIRLPFIQSAHFFPQMQNHNIGFVLLEFHALQAVLHTAFLRFEQVLQLRCLPMLLLFVCFLL